MLAWGKADAGASLLCSQGPRRRSQDLVQKDLESQLKINLSTLRGLALSVLGPEDSPKGRAWERNTIHSASTPPFQSSLALQDSQMPSESSHKHAQGPCLAEHSWGWGVSRKEHSYGSVGEGKQEASKSGK